MSDNISYKRINNTDIAALCEMTDKSRVIFDGISPDYAHDELAEIECYPEVLIRVTSTDEVSAIIKYAYERCIPVVVRGSGTGLVGSSVAVNGGIMLETTLMNHIISLDENNLTVTVEPGVLLMELAKFVEDNDLFYPPDPGEKTATIGGNISTNAGGMRAVKYGVTRDYVRELTVVLPNGEVAVLGGKVAKNSSGYSLKDLVIGSEGTLCIITQAVLRLLPLPKKTVSILAAFSDIRTSIETVPKIIRSKTVPTAIEFMERDTILFSEEYLGKRFPETRYPAYLLLTCDGNTHEQVTAECEKLASLCLDEGANDVFSVDTDERKNAVWGARGAFLEAIKASTPEMDECDVVVPRDKVAEFVMFTHELSERLQIRIPSFGHAGDGNLHIYVCRDSLTEQQYRSRLTAAFDAMYEKSRELCGLVSGEHGIGYAKKQYYLQQTSPAVCAVMQGIKSVFDPKNILNPNKIFQ